VPNSGEPGRPIRVYSGPRLPLSLFDWNRCTAALANMEPWWKPGSAYFYHALTFGYLAGELVRRVSGKTVGQLVDAEVAGPLKLDLWIGLPSEQEHRVAPHIVPAAQLSEEQGRALFSSLGLDMNSYHCSRPRCG
jgi:CubicO group peptidase (beta-lactamase class C family)